MTNATTTVDITTSTVWGVAVTTPDGHRTVDTRRDLLTAIHDAHDINREYPGAATVVYRQEQAGPWSDDLTGNSYGNRYEWEDGHVEYEPADSRVVADMHTRGRLYGNQPGATARTVSRAVVAGEWQPFTAADRPLDEPMPTGFITTGPAPRPAPRPAAWTGWLRTGRR